MNNTRSLKQYRLHEDARIQYWFAQEPQRILVYIKNTGTVNFIITDFFINGQHMVLDAGLVNGGNDPLLIYAGTGWRTFPVGLEWIESTEENLVEYHIQIISHRGNMFETIAIPDEDHYWVR
ncbi:MAG: hypothetical protein ACXADH_13240 [Candidatus Kariarchaeaceae archaeon]